MDKIIGPKASGKTASLIRKSANSGDYIVCKSQDEAAGIQSLAAEMQLRIPFPITYDEFAQGRYCGKNISGFLIDNVDIFLSWMSKAPVNAITMTMTNAYRDDLMLKKAVIRALINAPEIGLGITKDMSVEELGNFLDSKANEIIQSL